jgi:hypothetical protein
VYGGATVSNEAPTLAEIFQRLIREQATTDPESGWLVMDITPEECEVLGRYFAYMMFGWAGELLTKRSKDRGILMRDWVEPVRIVDEQEERQHNKLIN